jgi:hypothetical protein
MPPYLDRYRNGEHEQVWAELLALGAQVRSEPLYGEALAVARETMGRARANIERLVPRLTEVGYQFAYPHAEDGPLRYSVFDPPDATMPERIAELERLVGPIPLALRAWYEVVGSISFIGAHPALAPAPPGDAPPVYSDPLVVDPIEIVLAEFRDWFWLISDHRPEKIEPFHIPISPDAYRKANRSGGAAYRVAVPDPAADAPLLNAPHNTTFVAYLRLAFRWGGFPGFAGAAQRPSALLAYLTRDLLPL